MDYLLENLDSGRFQKLCQSLLIKEFPNVQCFPIAQPDGGRDAIAYDLSEASTKDFIVFQIKQSKDQLDPHKWLIEIMEGEAPKVSKLIPKGAKAYYLITNVQGTAHPDFGSIDKISKILRDAIDIPAICWWRDDLNRRLDNAWDLKWAYPEIMTGRDMLRYILESGLSRDNHRLALVIKTFIQGQYTKDEVVRFKQGGLLQSKLINLFIDVPIGAKTSHDEHLLTYIRASAMRTYPETDETGFFNVVAFSSNIRHVLSKEEVHSMGAARVLLHPIIQEKVQQIVLEGAPGQGKSTIVQYVCQMHRMSILRENLNVIPIHDRPTSVRIPIKVDLRDYATWLNGQNPFSSEEDREKPEGWYKALEAFLAAQIRYDSGGANFSVDDLQEVARISSLLLVLDGFDEVAEISKRNEIVSEVTGCVRRLRTIAASLQVIITSRPAAFANSPGFSEKYFPHFELASLTLQQINDYAAKWIRSQGLNNRDGADIKGILKEKLNQPYLRDLARNPMQLAILLTLIHLRGPSLPDQRTALYDSYVERFFDREADKSLDVRENRNLLINIHSYLAWILHSEAEQGHDRGSVNTERLRHLLVEYLTDQELEPLLAEKLVISTVDRIFFLVSRVQGTFEFEVQPLREYFAARYLYKTAPLPPPGAIRSGTIIDRFEAIAKNFYWLNVARFFAGFYNQGELPSLLYQLQDLAKKEGYGYIGHPKILAAMLLIDSVFSQYKRVMKDVLALVIDRLGLRYFSSANDRYSGLGITLVLPKESGRGELIKFCIAALHEKYGQDYISLFIDLLKANCSQQEIKELWFNEIIKVIGVERTKWLQYGFHLETLVNLTHEDVETFLSDDPINEQRLILLFRTGQLKKDENYDKRCTIIINSILNRNFITPSRQRTSSLIELFGQTINPSRYALTLEIPEPLPLVDLFKRRHIITSPLDTLSDAQNPSSENEIKCRELIETAEIEQHRTAKEWATELEPWDKIVEKSRSLWGEQWLHYTFANLASGIKSPKETCKDFSDLFDNSKSLCRRARYARLRAGAPDWWENQIKTSTTEIEIMFTLLVLLTWGSSNTIVYLSEMIDTAFKQLYEENWLRLMRSLKHAISLLHGDPFFDESRESGLALDTTKLPPNLSARTVTAIGARIKLEDRLKLYQKSLIDYQGTDVSILQFCQSMALESARVNPDHWQEALHTIAKCYTNGIVLDRFDINPKKLDIPLHIAEEIAQHSEIYPRSLVLLTEEIFKEIVASNVVAVGKIAKIQHWFEE